LHALVVGNLMDAAGSVGEDLETDRGDWSASPLVAALAGDESARAVVRDQEAEQEVPEVPEEELVAAVDPGHRAVLARVLAGQDLAVATPPGTTSLELVVDLAEELNARGRTVLIVSQRRRSLAQLVQIASRRDPDQLGRALSPDPSLQRNASAALLRSLRRAGSHGLGPDDVAPEELGTSRDILVGHVEAMHRVQHPWDASAHDAISALAALTRLSPAPRTQVRLRADVAATMIGADRARFAGALRGRGEDVGRRGPRSAAGNCGTRCCRSCAGPAPAAAGSSASPSPPASTSCRSASPCSTGCGCCWAPSSPRCSPHRWRTSSRPPRTSAGARSA